MVRTRSSTTSAPSAATPPAPLLALALAALAALGLAPPALAVAEGETVTVTGTVTDADGTPLSGVLVILEGARSASGMRTLGSVSEDPVRVRTVTAAEGAFTLDWTWRRSHRSFQILAAVEVPLPGGQTRLEVLARAPLSRQMRAGSPVVSALVVDDTAFLDELRAFLGGLRTDDHRRVYEELGKPDTVRQSATAGRKETSWWYFRLGKVARFEDGRLREVQEFEPVEPF